MREGKRTPAGGSGASEAQTPGSRPRPRWRRCAGSSARAAGSEGNPVSRNVFGSSWNCFPATAPSPRFCVRMSLMRHEQGIASEFSATRLDLRLTSMLSAPRLCGLRCRNPCPGRQGRLPGHRRRLWVIHRKNEGWAGLQRNLLPSWVPKPNQRICGC